MRGGARLWSGAVPVGVLALLAGCRGAGDGALLTGAPQRSGPAARELWVFADPVELRADGAAVVHAGRVITSRRPFQTVLPSWNVEVREGASFVVELRVRGAAGEWSQWLHVGDWGDEVPPLDERVTRCADGHVDVDVFIGDRPCTALQYRVRASGAAVRLQRVALALVEADDATTWADGDDGVMPAVRLDVPFRNQVTDHPELLGRLCGPASLAMVLAYHGVDVPVGVVARLCHDPRHDIYGGWPRTVQAAHMLGLSGRVESVSDWSVVRCHLAAGRPLIAAVRVERDYDELPYGAIGGHLVVVTGLAVDGTVSINDPAFDTPERGRFGVPRAVMESIWLRQGGVALVLEGPAGAPAPRKDR